MIRIGLTGGIASGKSTVSRLLAEDGAVIVDADLLARHVVAPGTPGLAEVVEAFGDGVLSPDGQLDRPALGALVFADPGRRAVLEGIIHPRVRAEGARLEAEAVEAGPGTVVVHDIPLLVETGQAAPGDPGRFDAVVVVDAPVETQVERMVRDRGWSVEEAEARIAAQASREERLAVATHVIDNTGTLDDLQRRVRQVVEEIVRDARR